jgi:hypothetical protein
VRPRPRIISATLIASCLALAACGGSDDETRPRPTTTAPSTSTTTTTPASADEAALRQLAEDWYETYNFIFESRGSGEEAAGYLVDPYLTQFEEQVAEYLNSGNQTDISERSSQSIETVKLDGDSAVITECIVNANVLRGPGGEVLNDDVGARRIETVAVREPNGWRLSERRALEDVEEAECSA